MSLLDSILDLQYLISIALKKNGVESIMTEHYPIPDEETRKHHLKNLRQTRLKLQEFGLELEEIIALLEKDIRQQRLKRLQKSKSIVDEFVEQ